MKRVFSRGFGTVLVMSLFMVTLGLISNGWALPVLTISDGTNTTTVTDDNGDGVVGYLGTIGGWDITISIGSSYPAIGEQDAPTMHLTGSTTSLSDNGTITFTLTDTFSAWNSNLTGLLSGFGGYGGSNTSVTFVTYLDDNKLAEFGPETGAFSNSLLTMITPENPRKYELKIIGTITTTAKGQAASFDGGIAPVPEPATIFLFGLGLIGIAGVARKRLINKA